MIVIEVNKVKYSSYLVLFSRKGYEINVTINETFWGMSIWEEGLFRSYKVC